MYYRLSNTARVDEIESAFGLPFRYPDLHVKNPLINGLEEESLPLITNLEPDNIQYGIWGILPEGFKEDWADFQKTQNTLNFHVKNLDSSKILSINKRCLFIVTGFFFSYEHDGEVYPFYAYSKSKEPFGLAGIFNKTYEGFITGSILLSSICSKFDKYNNLSNTMPIVVGSDNYNAWLGEDYVHLLKDNLSEFDRLDFHAHSIAKEFYKNDIIYNSLLEPTDYKALSIQF